MFVKMGIQLEWEIMLLPPVDENAAVVLPSTAVAILLNPPPCRHVDDSWHKAWALYHNMKTLWLWQKNNLSLKETDANLSVKFVFGTSATSVCTCVFTVLYCTVLSLRLRQLQKSHLKSCPISQRSGMFSPVLRVESLSDVSVWKYFHLSLECECS